MSRIARMERAIIGAGMRLIALIAERRVRRGLADTAQKPQKQGEHVHLEDRGRPKG